MNTPVKLAGFAVGLVAVLGAAMGLGSVVGPVGPAAEELPAAHDDGGHEDGGHEKAATGADLIPAGLTVSDGGHTLALDAPTLPAGGGVPVSFRILDVDGHPVTRYETEHDEDLHLIAVRRDLAGYQHVHPELGADGVWRVPLDLSPGSWRLFADFTPTGGENLTLGADLAVAGEFAPEPLPGIARTAEVGGYTVTLDGDLAAGEETELTLSVSRDGEPVRDLQPYLGAYGHLVVLRPGDLAYLHVHPTGEPGDGRTSPGPGIPFATTAPTAGTYRAFLEFRHGDVVRTAAFTLTADSHEEDGS